MNFLPFTEDLQRALRNAQNDIPNIVQRANHAILLCRDLLRLFKSKVTADGFDSVEKEIEFFKNVKTVPLAQLIYFTQIRSFELEFPQGNTDLQRKFIKKRLNRLNQFFKEHIEFKDYIESGFTHFDEQFFTREYLDKFPNSNSAIYFRDPEFSTARDMLFAEFQAFNLYVSYLQNRLIDKGKMADGKVSKMNTHISLQWTFTKSALTELVYALHYNHVINNGNADIKEIAMAMQRVFHFDLGDFYKTFDEIKNRKISRTKFLDDLASGLQSHMDSTEE